MKRISSRLPWAAPAVLVLFTSGCLKDIRPASIQERGEAPIVRYAGTQEIDGTTYDRVYVTWGSVAANCRYDQYVVYIDPGTRYIAKMFYTVREQYRFISGAVHYDDFRRVGRFVLPFSQIITAQVDDDEPVHHIRLESVALQVTPVADLDDEPRRRL